MHPSSPPSPSHEPVPALAGTEPNTHPAGQLRIFTCGSVDDGKSTLIGRLLHDTRSVHLDQLEAVQRASVARRREQVDLSLLTDGLRAEREQGITIDVAYRYFATARRRFILADTPGHVQYTRNMATGASTADAAIILVDARHGVVEQTRRHACIAALLGISHLIVCINKMDLVSYSKDRVGEVQAAFETFARAARPDGLATIAERTRTAFVPISALLGDNVVHPSERMPWHTGPALLEMLESLPDAHDNHREAARLPVQYVLRAGGEQHNDYRGYAGRLASGSLAVGDEVLVLPAGHASRVTRLHVGLHEVQACRAPASVAVVLEHDIDVSRGDLIIRASESTVPEAPITASQVAANVVWMAQQPLAPGRRFLIKHTTRIVPGVARVIDHRVNIAEPSIEPGAPQLALNEIGRVQFKLSAPIVFDPYARCRGTGGFIIIDEQTNGTVGAGMLLAPHAASAT